MANLSNITDSIPLKKFLNSLYGFIFFVEKSAGKIAIYAKDSSLPDHFVGDLARHNSNIKIRNNKVGMTLPEWREFVSNVQKGQDISTDSKVNIIETQDGEVTSIDVEDKKDYSQLSRSEFVSDPPKVLNTIDWDGRERKYELEKERKSYNVFDKDVLVTDSALQSVHEKLLCQAYKEGKKIDLEQTEKDYPYFRKKCINNNLEVEDIHNSPDLEGKFITALHQSFEQGKKLNKRDLEKLGLANGISEITTIYELAEYAWIKWYRKLVLRHTGDKKDIYEDIVKFYLTVQPTFSLRDSVRIEFQQYSTAAPISYLAQLYCKLDEADLIFEPSAGNGLLIFAAPYEKTIVNELDRERLANLKKEPFMEVLNQDAERPFIELRGKVDAVLSNPPFGRLSEKVRVDGYKIKQLDHSMVMIALETLKDSGRAAIIIGSHTQFNEDGMIRSSRIFFNWLFHFYHVSDIINVNGDLYAKQGTNFDIRLILIAGRKEKPDGFAPMIKDFNHPLRQTVQNFDELFIRVKKSLENPFWLFAKGQDKKVIEPFEVIPHKPLHEISLYEFGTTSPLNTYSVKRIEEVDLEIEDCYKLAHIAQHGSELYYVMRWRSHYNGVLQAIKEGHNPPYEVLRDYKDILRKHYPLDTSIATPLSYEDWIEHDLVVSIGFELVTHFSAISGKVFYNCPRKIWDRLSEDEILMLYKKVYQTTFKTDSKATENAIRGDLIVISNQLKIANTSDAL